MKKLIGLYFRVETDKSEFFNFKPVMVLSDEYDGRLGFHEIFWDLSSFDYQIKQLCPNPNYRYINIDWYKTNNQGNTSLKEDMELRFDYETWGVLDVDKAWKYVKDQPLRKNVHWLPYSIIMNDTLSLSGNNSVVLVGSEDDKDIDWLATGEEFYILDKGKEYKGPYILTSNGTKKSQGWAKWLMNSNPLLLKCAPFYGDDEEEFTIKVALPSSLSKQVDIEPVTKKAAETKPIQKEKSIELATIPPIQNQHLFPAVSLENAKGIVSIEKTGKAEQPFTVDAFKGDLEGDYVWEKKAVFNSLRVFNAVHSQFVRSILVKEDPDVTVDDVNEALEQLLSVGYLQKKKDSDIDDYYSLSKRGIKTFGKKSACNYLKVDYIDDFKPAPVGESKLGFDACIAYMNVMQDLYKNIDFDYYGLHPAFFGNSYLLQVSLESTGSVYVLGVFDQDPEALNLLEDAVTEIFETGEVVSRLFLLTEDRDYAFSSYGVLKDRFDTNEYGFPHNTYIYALQDESYYSPETEDVVFVEDILPDLSSTFKQEEPEAASEPEIQTDGMSDNNEKIQKDLEKAQATLARIAEQTKTEEKREKAAKKRADQAEEEAKISLAKAERAKAEASSIEKSVFELKNRLDEINIQITEGKDSLTQLKKQSADVLKSVERAISKPEFTRVMIDGQLASIMSRAAADWETEQTATDYSAYCEYLNNLPNATIPGGILNYVVEKVKKVRPSYSSNDIINIAICIAQSFITVFSGDPGSGKTSICNIFAQVLGLDLPVAGFDYGRYVPISVGRGWTSQRDFIGYYNPLSKEFDRSNQRAYDAFCIANEEGEASVYPLFILLDEANLSPMEHYWSEFIRICDDRTKYNTINCGGAHIFIIPDTMRFLATINNDDTTTSLSPRMVDRSWVITLPMLSPADMLEKGRELDDSELVRVTWKSFYDTFGPQKSDAAMEREVAQLLTDIMQFAPGLNINNRVFNSIIDYYSAAKFCFDPSDNKHKPLDYAVSQRILPKIGGIDGQGDEFRKQLENLRDYLQDKVHFEKSAQKVQEIITKGKDIGYYEFF